MIGNFPPSLRKRADALADQGRWADAYALRVRAAQAYPDAVMAALCWEQAAQAAMVLGRRTEQIDCARRALALLERQWPETPLVRGVRIDALHRLALGLSASNDLSGAARTARQAVALAEGRDAPRHLAAARILGLVLLRQGLLGEALTAMAHTVTLARGLDDRLDVAQALVDLGVVALHAGDTITARNAGDEAWAIASASQGADHEGVQAGALLLRSRVAREEHRHQEAVALAREAMWLVTTTGQPNRLGEVRTVLANNLMVAGDADEAITLTTRTYTEAEEHDDAGRAAMAAANLAAAHGRAGDLDQAAEWGERSLALVRDATDRDQVVSALAILARVRHLQGDYAAAEATLLRAIDVCEDMRAAARDEVEHIELLTRQSDVHRFLQQCRVAAGDADGALEAVMSVRGLLLDRQRVDVGRSTDARRVTPADLAEAAARHDATILVYSLPGPPGFTTTPHSTTVYIWAIAPDGTRRHVESPLTALHRIADASTPPDHTGPPEEQALHAVGSAARDSRLIETRPALTDTVLRVMADAFLRPVEDMLRRTRRLIVVPDGFVNVLPFHALPLTEGTALIEHGTVTLATSPLSLLAADTPATPVTPAQALVVGNPSPLTEPLVPGLPPPALADLPDAEREARQTAALYGADPLLGPAATRDEVLRRLPHSRFAHFATHGLAGQDHLRIPGALCLTQAYLRADDISPLDLSDCRLVVLSACETGRGRFTPEGNLGLPRAFLAAGADCVVMSLGPIHDTPTADLMTAMHRALAQGTTVGEALRHAVLQTRDRHPAPDHWSAFTVFGDDTVRLHPTGA